MIRAPACRPTLVDPYREHLRTRRAEDPAVPLTHLLGEITRLGYTGSANLLMRCITQGRVEADHATLSPKKVTGLLLTDPADLHQDERELREKLGAACPEMTELSALIGRFAAMLTPEAANAQRLGQWITRLRAANLPTLGSFATGLERDRDAVEAALTLPYHNGRPEGVNQKLLKRQTYGRAGFPLLRQRILLSWLRRSTISAHGNPERAISDTVPVLRCGRPAGFRAARAGTR